MTRRIAAVLVFVAAFAVYANTLRGGFVYDDTFQVLSNPWIQDVKHLGEIFLSDVWKFGAGQVSGATSYYRPLMYVIYMVCYALFGLQPWGFHLVNLLLHSGASVLVFLLTARLLEGGESRVGETPLAIPLAAGLIFAVHPVHTEAVAWVGALPELAFSFFCLLSLLLYTVAGKAPGGRIRYAASLGAFALALLSKEPAIVLPVVLVAYDFLVGDSRPSTTRDFARRYGPFVLVTFLYLVLRTVALGSLVPVATKSGLGLSPSQGLLNVFPLFLHYLAKMLLPVQLTAFYRFHVESVGEPWAIAGLLSIPVLIAIGWVFYRRDRVALFGLIVLLLPLAPVLYIPALQANTMAERYAYLPSFGLILIAASGAKRLLRAAPRSAIPLAVVTCALIALMSLGTIYRNRIWRTDTSLWTDTLSRPVDASRHVVWGNRLASQGDVRGAIEQYRFAAELEPEDALIRNKLGLAYAQSGDLESAISEFTAVARLEPDARTLYNLGVLYRDTQRREQAIEHFEKALQLDPDLQPAQDALETLRQNPGLPRQDR